MKPLLGVKVELNINKINHIPSHNVNKHYVLNYSKAHLCITIYCKRHQHKFTFVYDNSCYF